MRVLFTTAPMYGHFFPLVPLAWACRSMGHEVLVGTSEHFVGSVVQAGLPAAPVGPGIAMHELGDANTDHGIVDARYAHGEVFARMSARNLAGTAAVVERWQPDVVISERADSAGPVAAALAGVPQVQLHWGVPELTEYRDAAETTLRPRLRRLGLAGLPEPSLTLNPWPASLRLPHARGHLGLRHVAHDGVARVANWMLEPGRRPRVCLTLGTVLPHLATQGLTGLLLGILEQLSTLDCELVVAVDDELAERLGPLPAAVRHAGRIPLSHIIPTCALLIHHGGHGTSLTALAAGCPQVALPRFDDQIENAHAVVRSGAGLSLPLGEATPESVAAICARVLGNPYFRAAALTLAGEMAAQPSPAELVGAFERLARGEDPHPELAASLAG